MELITLRFVHMGSQVLLPAAADPGHLEEIICHRT